MFVRNKERGSEVSLGDALCIHGMPLMKTSAGHNVPRTHQGHPAAKLINAGGDDCLDRDFANSQIKEYHSKKERVQFLRYL